MGLSVGSFAEDEACSWIKGTVRQSTLGCWNRIWKTNLHQDDLLTLYNKPPSPTKHVSSFNMRPT